MEFYTETASTALETIYMWNDGKQFRPGLKAMTSDVVMNDSLQSGD